MSNKNESDKPKAGAAPETTVVTDASLDVFEHNEVDEHPSLTVPEALVLHGGKVGGILDIIASLIKNNYITQAIAIITLLSNRDSKWGDILDAIQKAISEVWGNNLPVPPKRLMLGTARPTRADVMAYMVEKGLNVSFLPPQLIGLLISLAVQFGLPFIQSIIQHFIDNQAKGLKY